MAPRTRHDAHAETTYHRFIEEVQQIAKVDRPVAEAAALSVLFVLEQRMVIDEVIDFESQLPSRLRDRLEVRRLRERWMQLRFDRAEFIERVADDLGVLGKQAERLVSAVFRAVSLHVSPGEINDIASSLPESLALLLRHPDNAYVPRHG